MNTGIYIHIPFCRSKCSYCSFVSRPWDEALADRYRRAVVLEMEAFAAAAPTGRHTVDSLYFGGGTPSILPADYLADMLEMCRKLFNIVSECEVTIEANPGTIEEEKLRVYRSIGVNRVSLGAQSFSDDELGAIGRIHCARQIGESAALLRACGFQNINLDLMLGLPGQTEGLWMANLEQAVALAPQHISIYMLELDPKVPLYHSVQRGNHTIPDDDLIADWYLQTIDFLDSCGYPQYEISNFAHPGCECRHNLKYWLREPVLAFGVAAHSHDGSARYANLANLIDYLAAVEDGRSPVEWRDAVDGDRDLEETLFLGLRLNRGVDWDVIRRTSGKEEQLAACEASLQEMAGMGLVEWHGSIVRLTRRGMLLSNEVFQKFVNIETRGDAHTQAARFSRTAKV